MDHLHATVMATVATSSDTLIPLPLIAHLFTAIPAAAAAAATTTTDYG